MEYGLRVHLQVLASGSEGNSLLLRAGETTALLDAGLTGRAMLTRLAEAGLAPGTLDHVFVSHGHLDHARSSGLVARKERATLHCAERYMQHPSFKRARSFATLGIDRQVSVNGKRGQDELEVRTVTLPHDCDPTVAFRFEHNERVAAVLTDMGEPRHDVAQKLGGANVIVLEFNYEPELMETGPYPDPLRRRITGPRGHLSNQEAGTMLEWMAGEQLHTVVLAHISSKTNTKDHALRAARKALTNIGREDVRVLAADQHQSGESLNV